MYKNLVLVDGEIMPAEEAGSFGTRQGAPVWRRCI